MASKGTQVRTNVSSAGELRLRIKRLEDEIRNLSIAVGEPMGTINTNNSSSTPLTGGAAFTGTSTGIRDVASIAVSVYSDVASATDGLSIQQSTDGTNWDFSDDFTIPAATGKVFTISPHAQYLRVVYTNGGSAQSAFRLQTILKGEGMTPSTHRIQDTLRDDDDGQLQVVIPKLRTAQDNYVSMAATNSGNQKVSVEEWNGDVETYGLPVQIRSPLTAFAEVETAPPENRFDCEFLYDKQPLIMDDISQNAGAATHNATSRDIQLTVTGATDVGGMRAHTWIPYTPGSGQKFEITGTLDEQNIGGGTAMVFLRSNVTGTVVEQEIDQSSWSAHTTGVDWSTSHILSIPFQSLKVGTVFYYLVASGTPSLIAKIDNDNIRATGYWQAATLPPYWRLYTTGGETIMEMGYGDELNAVGIRYNLGTANYTATMRAICCTVKSQGGKPIEDIPGYPFVAEQLSAKTVSTTEIPLISIRMAATFNSITNRTLAIPGGVEIQTDNPIFYRVRYRPSLTGPSFATFDSNSALEQDTTATAVSGGKVVDAGFIASTKNTEAAAKGILSRVLMSLGSTGTTDILSLTAVRTSGTDASVLSAIKGKEIR